MARIEQSIEVNVPAHTAYHQLTQFEQYPRFMDDVREVRQLDDTHLHWHTKTGNLDLEWDAEITQQVPDRCIAWRNISGPRYEGKIELNETDPERTRLTVTMECDPKQQLLAQHGDAETMIAQRTEHDLTRFKKFIEKIGRETGEGRGKASDAKPQEEQPAQADGAAVGKTVGRTASERDDAARSGRQQARPGGDGRDQEPQATPRAEQQEADRQPGQQPPSMQPWLPSLLQAWNQPFDMMRRMSEDMDRLMERFIGTPMHGLQAPRGTAASAWAPPVEISQREDRFVVCAELPGVKREHVQVEIKNGRLTIEGERHQEAPHAPQEQRRSERSYGHFYRVIALPSDANTDAASASMHDGLLEITVPVMRSGQHGRRLDIQSPH